MRKIKLAVMLLLLCNYTLQTKAQNCPNLLQNWDLEWSGNPNEWVSSGPTFNHAPIDLDAFNEGSVASWYAVNASPDIFDNLGLGNTFDCARLGANPNIPTAWEGIGQTFMSPILAGRTYLVNLQARQNVNTPWCNLEVRFANGTNVLANASGNLAFAQNVFQTQWLPISFCFTADRAYTDIHVSNRYTGTGNPPDPSAWMLVDQIEVYEVLATPIASATQVCVNSLLTLSEIACNPPNTTVSYQWFDQAGNLIGTTQSINVNPSTAGNHTYTVVKTVQTANGNICQTASNIVVSVVTPSGTVSASSASVCQGSSVQLIAEGGVNYLWTPNDGTLSDINIANPIATPTETTTYSVTITDANGCVATKDVVVTVNNIDVDLGNDLFICPGETVQLDALTSGGIAPYNYSWSANPSSALSGTPTTSSITTDQVGEYTVIVTDDNGCVASDAVNVMNTIDVSKIATVGGEEADVIYSGQTITYEVELCNNTTTTITGVNINDVLPSNFVLDQNSLSAGLSFDGVSTISGIVNLNTGCTTFTYSGHYNIPNSSTDPVVIAQDPNVLSISYDGCVTTTSTGSRVAESCPGFNRVSPTSVDRNAPVGTEVIDYLNVHKPYYDMTNVQYDLYYPYFLSATGDYVVHNDMVVTNDPNDPQDAVLQNLNTIVSPLYKKLRLNLKMVPFDIYTCKRNIPFFHEVRNIICLFFLNYFKKLWQQGKRRTDACPDADI